MTQKINLKNALGLTILLAFVLVACGSDEETLQEEAISQIYTSVAQTVEALPTDIPPTATATLVMVPATITPFPTMTTAAPSGVYPTATRSTITQTQCKDALYMSDITIPDGTVFSAGESFEKTWLILNGGTCAWEANYILNLSNGDEMNGVPVAIGQVVSPNGQVEVSVQFTAPLIPGSYTSYWQMTDGLGTKFGNSIFVMITVSGDATATHTATHTATLTNTGLPTETYTPEPTATDTPIPTETPIP